MVSRRPMDKQVVHVRQGVTSSQQSITLHTATTRKTLVRIVGNLSVQVDDSAESGGATFVIVKVPEGVSAPAITAIATSSAVVLDALDHEVLWAGALAQDAVASGYHWSFNIDVKGQRILREGDTIMFLCKSSVADMGDWALVVTEFFKE